MSKINRIEFKRAVNKHIPTESIIYNDNLYEFDWDCVGPREWPKLQWVEFTIIFCGGCFNLFDHNSAYD